MPLLWGLNSERQSAEQEPAKWARAARRSSRRWPYGRAGFEPVPPRIVINRRKAADFSKSIPGDDEIGINLRRRRETRPRIRVDLKSSRSSSLSDWGFGVGDFGELNVLRRGIGVKRG